MSTGQSEAIAARLVESVNKRDLDQFGTLLAPDIVYWNNVTEQEADRDALIAHVERDYRIFTHFAYEEIDSHPFDDGFVLRMRGRAVTVAGHSLDFPICIVGLIRAGLLVRLEDWVNPQKLALAFASRSDQPNI